jgi:hypothetical protein
VNFTMARSGSGHAVRRVFLWRTGSAVHGVAAVLSAAVNPGAAVILSAAKDLGCGVVPTRFFAALRMTKRGLSLRLG